MLLAENLSGHLYALQSYTSFVNALSKQDQLQLPDTCKADE